VVDGDGLPMIIWFLHVIHIIFKKMQNLTMNIFLFFHRQEFAWAEEDRPKRRADRGSSLKGDVAAELAKEPMFCFEARPMAAYIFDSKQQHFTATRY